MGAMFGELCRTSASAYSGLTSEVMIVTGNSDSSSESSWLLGGWGNGAGAG